MKRRDLMIGTGGLATALFTGRIPDVAAQDDEQLQQRMGEKPETAIELLPPESRIDPEYARIMQADIDDEDDKNQIPYMKTVMDIVDTLDVPDIETMTTAWTSEQPKIQTVSGSFDRPEPGERVNEYGDWWIGNLEDEATTVASTSDLLVVVDGDDAENRIDLAEESCMVGRGLVDGAIEEIETLDVAFDALEEKKIFYYVPSDTAGFPTDIVDQLETVNAGFDIPPSEIRGYEGTVANKFVLEASADTTLGEDDVEEIMTELEQGAVVERDIEFDGELVFVETVIEAPPELNRDAAPEAQVSLEGKPDAGTATLKHESGETIPADALELWINGERAETQLAEKFDMFEPGDSVTVQTGPVASVFLRWVSEDTNEYFGYVNDVVGKSAVETSYDLSAGTVELTYTAENEVETELLELEHRWEVTENDQTRYEREQLTEPLTDLGDTLTAGESIVVEDVDLQDTVTLELDVPSKPPGTFGPDTTLAWVRARKPRFSIRRQLDEGLVVNYHDRTPRDAESFRILLDGTEAGTQPSDEYETLERGDELSLDTVSPGTELVIQWLGGESPVVVKRHVVEPQIQFDIGYDDGDGTVTIEHRSGEEVSADSLELLFDGTPAGTQPGDQYETFTTGDTVTASADPFTRVEIRWSDDETELTLTERVTGRELFSANYDPASKVVELTYTGQQPTEPERISVQAYGPDTEISESFAEQYETLTAGDNISIEDVEREETIQVRLVNSEESRRRVLFWFRPKPGYAFEFETRDDALVAVYRAENPREADAFRILADDTETETQPSDEHDILEQGDEIELGSFEPGTTVVVEWPAGNDPSEVHRHVVTPAADFEASYDEDAGVVRIEHAGGDEIDSQDISVYVPQATEEPVEWDGDQTVSDGDSMTIEAEERPQAVVVLYREQEVLAELSLES